MIPKTDKDETRNEIITFPDGSEMEIDQQMRNDCMEAYDSACSKGVAKRFIEKGNL